MANISFDIINEIGVLSESTSGWQKELKLI